MPVQGDKKVAQPDPYAEAISAELHEIFLEQGRRFPFAALVVVWLLVYVALDEVPLPSLLVWGGVVSLLAIVRQLLCIGFSRASTTPERLRIRLRIVVVVWVLVDSLPAPAR